MQPKNIKRIISASLSVIASVLLLGAFVYAATTIGTNISTTGTTSMTTASTTDDFWLGNQTADDDDYLYMDASSTEYLMWDESPGQFAMSDDLEITGNASVTEALIIGSDDQTDNDIIYFDGKTENFTWNNTAAEFTLSDDLHLNGQYVSSTNMMIDNWATTTNMWVGATNSANATSVLVLGDSINTNSSVCIKIRTTSDQWVYAYATSSTSLIGMGLVWTSTSCE